MTHRCLADDVPLILQDESGSIVELPVPTSVDDYDQYVSSRAFDHLMKVPAPRQAMEVDRAEFDAMWEFGGLWVSLRHPAVSGRTAPALAIRDLLGYMRELGDVWLVTLKEVAHWTRRLTKEGLWQPRVDRALLCRAGGDVEGARSQGSHFERVG